MVWETTSGVKWWMLWRSLNILDFGWFFSSSFCKILSICCSNVFFVWGSRTLDPSIVSMSKPPPRASHLDPLSRQRCCLGALRLPAPGLPGLHTHRLGAPAPDPCGDGACGAPHGDRWQVGWLKDVEGFDGASSKGSGWRLDGWVGGSFGVGLIVNKELQSQNGQNMSECYRRFQSRKSCAELIA